MKDKLLYLTIGLLVGIIVMQWSAGTAPQDARANYVVPGATGIVVHEGNGVIDQFGVLWNVGQGDWELVPNTLPPPPVPVENIKFWQNGGNSTSFLITNDNELWYYNRALPDDLPGYLHWESRGFWPGAPVPTQQQSIGGVKNLHKGD